MRIQNLNYNKCRKKNEQKILEVNNIKKTNKQTKILVWALTSERNLLGYTKKRF